MEEPWKEEKLMSWECESRGELRECIREWRKSRMDNAEYNKNHKENEKQIRKGREERNKRFKQDMCT